MQSVVTMDGVNVSGGPSLVHLRPVSESRFSENPEMRETLGSLFQKGRLIKAEREG